MNPKKRTRPKKPQPAPIGYKLTPAGVGYLTGLAVATGRAVLAGDPDVVAAEFRRGYVQGLVDGMRKGDP